MLKEPLEIRIPQAHLLTKQMQAFLETKNILLRRIGGTNGVIS